MKEIRIRRLSLEEARRLLEQELNAAFLAGEERVAVIHGVGQGKLKALVETIVGECGFARIHAREALFYNAGVTLVDLFPPQRRDIAQYMRR